jgi:hypothetical protein
VFDEMLRRIFGGRQEQDDGKNYTVRRFMICALLRILLE